MGRSRRDERRDELSVVFDRQSKLSSILLFWASSTLSLLIPFEPKVPLVYLNIPTNIVIAKAPIYKSL